MRFHLLGLAYLAVVAAPAAAQDWVEPEIRSGTQADAAGQIGIPASSAIADLTSRVDALESQLARLTGQYEEATHRVRMLEDELATYRATADLRFKELEAGPAPATEAPTDEPATDAEGGPNESDEITAPDTGDAAEDAYLVGFRLWEAKRYAEAQKALEAAAKAHPRHRRASYALNLAGRAWLDDGKPATAAKLFLSNYQTNPKGERAADSLYFLGQSLVKLDKPAQACKVYDELADVYPNMREWLAQRLPKAREDADCS